ncbi:MAG TPA: hypothetical protein VL527_16660 [Dongiaceae bacterium]|nr:hypothetical protein [Dongiaceae bacterium]
MNALLKKEIRLLGPSFAAGLVATLGILFLGPDPGSSTALIAIGVFLAVVAVVIFLALSSFGAEMSAGTFALLLAQPVSRERIWRIKTGLLAGALVLGGCFWCALLYLRFVLMPHPKGFADFWDIAPATWIFLPVIYSGALWTVLLFRQVMVAFWVTLLLPAVLLQLLLLGLGEDATNLFPRVAVGLMLVYSIAGFIFARRLFLHAEDIAWTGGNITLPEVRGLNRWLSRGKSQRTRRPVTALFWKELLLHQAQLLVAGGLAVIHLVFIVVRNVGHVDPSGTTAFLLTNYWAIWIIMPVLVGAAALAEERKFGTQAGQLCLPVSPRAQFWLKLGTTLLVGVLLGLVPPLVLEGLASVAAPWLHLPVLLNPFGRILHPDPGALLAWLLLVLALGFVSFYASTLTRNSLQALGPAILGIMLLGFIGRASYQPWLVGLGDWWRGGLLILIATPLLILTLLRLAGQNFRVLQFSGADWRRNLISLIATLALAVVATTAIFHRFWEKLTPLPAHGLARWSLQEPPVLRSRGDVYEVTFPDGRAWVGSYISTSGSHWDYLLGNYRFTASPNDHFVAGGDWQQLVRLQDAQLAGIKSDGSLWVAAEPRGYVQNSHPRPGNPPWMVKRSETMIRVGAASDWQQIAPNFLSALLIKKDGTLWRWGTNNWDFKHHKWPGMQTFIPERVGTESDWAELSFAGWQLVLRQTNGQVWSTGTQQTRRSRELAPGLAVGDLGNFGTNQWRSLTTVCSIGNWNNSEWTSCRVGVREDGTLHAFIQHRSDTANVAGTVDTTDVPLSRDAQWVQAASCNFQTVTLKRDGSLWLWDFPLDYQALGTRVANVVQTTKPVRMDPHSDWVAIADAGYGIISLAADGSLWYWPLLGTPNYVPNRYDASFFPLLDFSRRPQKLTTIPPPATR